LQYFAVIDVGTKVSADLLSIPGLAFDSNSFS